MHVCVCVCVDGGHNTNRPKVEIRKTFWLGELHLIEFLHIFSTFSVCLPALLPILTYYLSGL